jgi:two-component system, OmpR family, response regulator CssR
VSKLKNYTINLVEDDQDLLEILSAYLVKEGWAVSQISTGTEALARAGEKVDLWVLDIMLPGVNGYEVLKKIKDNSDVPIIFISARDQDLDRITGLEMGSEDYLAKPFLPQELVIRVKKILTRIYEPKSSPHAVQKVHGYTISPITRKLHFGEEEIELTSRETDVLLYLLQSHPETKSRDDILYHVWGKDYVGSKRAVDDVIRRIRKKMPRLNLETVYGGGYRIV